MDDKVTERKVYELLDDDNNRNPSVCSKVCSCLYAYTIGSCLYCKNDTNLRENTEEVELKSMLSMKHKNGEGVSDLEEGDSGSGEWRKRTACKADCKMKKRIQYHFKDHIRRWTDANRRRFPWKVILHLLLVVLVTTQVS